MEIQHCTPSNQLNTAFELRPPPAAFKKRDVWQRFHSGPLDRSSRRLWHGKNITTGDSWSNYTPNKNIEEFVKHHLLNPTGVLFFLPSSWETLQSSAQCLQIYSGICVWEISSHNGSCEDALVSFILYRRLGQVQTVAKLDLGSWTKAAGWKPFSVNQCKVVVSRPLVFEHHELWTSMTCI